MVTAESCRCREGTRLGRVGDGGKPLAVGIRVPPGTSLGPVTLCLTGRQEQAPAQRNACELQWGLWGGAAVLELACSEPSTRCRSLSPAPSVDAWCPTPSWSILRCFFPPSGTPAATFYRSRQEHPCWAGFPSAGIPHLPSVLRQGSVQRLGVLLGTRAPLPISVTAVPRTL